MARIQIADEHFHKALGLLDHNFIYYNFDYTIDDEGLVVVKDKFVTTVEEIFTSEDIDYEIVYYEIA